LLLLFILQLVEVIFGHAVVSVAEQTSRPLSNNVTGYEPVSEGAVNLIAAVALPHLTVIGVDEPFTSTVMGMPVPFEPSTSIGAK
jgi:hypothetical protein